jgi:hypothetical protein
MKILEFDLPLLITPKRAYRIKDLNLIILPTDNPEPKSDYFGPMTSTKLILYNSDIKEARRIITDLIRFSNFLNQNYHTYIWLFNHSFLHQSKYEKTVNNLNKYVKELTIEQKWYLNADFNMYPLMEITPNPTKINFRSYFLMYTNLDLKSPAQFRIKNLIDFFSYDYLTSIIMNKVYSNANLQISNSFIMIEALINLDIKNQTGYKICPNCGAELPGKKSMIELVEEFLKMKVKNPEICNILISILKRHYETRNVFIHNAKYESLNEKTDNLIRKLGRTHVALIDEIEHSDAFQTGLFTIHNLIRLELLHKLKKVSST